ncbi:MAG: hypothetical protein C0505_17365 [Leptothrix sp. (in: Bacteria)]|nr:hypothetical protein [Leptothrix sp. (in: b-proteobacteria)]
MRGGVRRAILAPVLDDVLSICGPQRAGLLGEGPTGTPRADIVLGDPAAGRHSPQPAARSPQLERDRRLCTDRDTPLRTAGLATVQQHLMALLDAVHHRFHAHLQPLTGPDRP